MFSESVQEAIIDSHWLSFCLLSQFFLELKLFQTLNVSHKKKRKRKKKSLLNSFLHHFLNFYIFTLYQPVHGTGTGEGTFQGAGAFLCLYKGRDQAVKDIVRHWYQQGPKKKLAIGENQQEMEKTVKQSTKFRMKTRQVMKRICEATKMLLHVPHTKKNSRSPARQSSIHWTLYN